MQMMCLPQKKMENFDNYTERGVEKGAKYSEGRVDNPDVLRILEETEALSLDEAVAWLDVHRDELDPTTLIVDTDDLK